MSLFVARLNRLHYIAQHSTVLSSRGLTHALCTNLRTLRYRENNYLQRLQRHTLFGNTFRSTGSKKKDTQKYITKKVQAYFKHLCALKLKFEAKMIWVCITKICLILFSYDEKSPTVIVWLFASVNRSSSPKNFKIHRRFLTITIHKFNYQLSSPICIT